jgi:predicted nuclease of predicted toxin-antitoxin system
MKIKVDEDLPRQVVDLFREKGYQADSVIEQGMAGWKDSDLWRTVQAESRFLVTADKGFADIRSYPPGSHPGVMLIRPDQDGIRPTMELVNRVLQEYGLDRLAGKLSVVTPRGIRVRRTV